MSNPAVGFVVKTVHNVDYFTVGSDLRPKPLDFSWTNGAFKDGCWYFTGKSSDERIVIEVQVNFTRDCVFAVARRMGTDKVAKRSYDVDPTLLVLLDSILTELVATDNAAVVHRLNTTPQNTLF